MVLKSNMRFLRIVSLPMISLYAALACAQAQTVPSVTPDGLFGFMDDSTVLKAGTINPKFGIAPSWSQATHTISEKITLNYGVSDRFEAGLAIAYAPTIAPAGTGNSQFINASIPLQYVFVPRMQNGMGIALVTQINLGRQFSPSSPTNTQWSIDNHLVIDHDWDGKYFAGINIGYTATDTLTQGHSEPNGLVYVQAGATVKINPSFYWGIQAQFSQQLNRFFSGDAGWASFLGTSISIPIDKRVTFSAAYMRQLVGSETDKPQSRLNTESFSQNMARAVLSFYF